jgi:hypothetical protein
VRWIRWVELGPGRETKVAQSIVERLNSCIDSAAVGQLMETHLLGRLPAREGRVGHQGVCQGARQRVEAEPSEHLGSWSL